MTTATQVETVQYTPPGGSVENIRISVTDTHEGRADGTFVIASGATTATEFALPVGPYKKVVVHNRLNGQNIGLYVNESATALLELPPDGEFSSASQELSAIPISNISIKNVGQQSADAEIDWFIFL